MWVHVSTIINSRVIVITEGRCCDAFDIEGK